MKFVQVLSILLVIVALISVVLMNRRMKQDKQSLISMISKYEDEKERADGLEGSVNAANARMEALEGSVSEANARVEELESGMADRDATITSLQAAEEEANATINSLQGSIDEANARVEELESGVADRDATITSLQAAKDEAAATISALEGSVAEKDQTIESLQNNTQQAGDIEALQAASAEKDQAIQALQNAAAEKDAAIQALQAESAEKDQTIETLKNDASQNSATIEALQAASAEKDQAIESLQAESSGKDQTIESLQAESSGKDQTIESLQAESAGKDQTIESLQAESSGKDQTIESLQSDASQMSATIEELQNATQQKDATIEALQAESVEKDQKIYDLANATPVPTPEPTPEPTPVPTPVPTPEPTPEPTPVPTPEPTPEPAFPLHMGSSNEFVATLQTKLTELGYTGVAADGDLGEGTMNTILRLQAAMGQEQTGTLTEEQYNAIMALQPSDHSNLIWDGRFTSIAEYWMLSGEPEAYEAVNGFFHMTGHGGISQVVELEAGTYTLSLVANGSEASQGSTFTCSVASDTEEHPSPAFVLAQEAQQYSYSFTVGTAGTYTVKIGSDAEVWYSKVKLEGGYVATEWTEHEGQMFIPLQIDNWSEDVKVLQAKMAELGFLTGKVDGIFGPGTENALKQLQQAMGLEPTGVVATSSEFEKILSLEPGDGANLIQNGDLTASTSGWHLWQKPQVCEIIVMDDAYWLHVVGAGGAKQSGEALAAGQMYTLSFTAFGAENSVGKTFTCGVQVGEQVYWTPEYVLESTPKQYICTFVPESDGEFSVLIGTGRDEAIEACYTNISLS